MRVARSVLCVARMRAGEVKRVPAALERPLVGYYIACPECGRVVAVLPSERTIVETGGTLSIQPALQCVRPQCAKRFAILRDQFIVSA